MLLKLKKYIFITEVLKNVDFVKIVVERHFIFYMQTFSKKNTFNVIVQLSQFEIQYNRMQNKKSEIS